MNDSAIDVEDHEDPRLRLKSLPKHELERMYGRGFKLLKKAGLKDTDSTAAPIKVAVRKPREGLQDDDIAGRLALGETVPSRKKRTDPILTEALNSAIVSVDTMSKVAEYLEYVDGSCSVAEVVAAVIRRVAPHCSVRQYLIALKISGTEPFGFKLSVDDKELVLTKPARKPLVREVISCVCGLASFRSVAEWASHVLSSLTEDHQAYMKTLSTTLPIHSDAYCLVCQSKHANMTRLILHCANSIDPQHNKLACICLESILRAHSSSMRELLLSAIESNDLEFPWECLDSTANDPLACIPFPDGPPTPIHLSDDDCMEVEELTSDEDELDAVEFMEERSVAPDPIDLED